MTFGLLLLTISAEVFFPVSNLHTGFPVITSLSAGEREEEGVREIVLIGSLDLLHVD